MADLWFPGTTRRGTGGTTIHPMAGDTSVRKATHHATEGDSLWGAVHWIERPDHRGFYSLIIDGRTGESVQWIQANRAARSMASGWSPGWNRSGTINIQIGWVGWSKNDPMRQARPDVLEKVLQWTDSWGVPRTMPSGPFNNNRKVGSDWRTKSGHYSHSQAPNNISSDPGRPPDALLYPDRVEECLMGLKDGNLNGNDMQVQPSEAVYVNWRQERDWHVEGAANIKLRGQLWLEIEHRADGPVTVSVGEMVDGKFSKIRREDHPAARCRTNLMVNAKDNIRIRVTNPTAKPVNVTNLAFRARWCD